MNRPASNKTGPAAQARSAAVRLSAHRSEKTAGLKRLEHKWAGSARRQHHVSFAVYNDNEAIIVAIVDG